MSAPLTQIHICSGVRLDPRYIHSIYFPSQTAQRNYFAEKVVKSFSAYSYLKKNWAVKVQATPADALKWSYLYFQNPQDGKTFYYFITDSQYINENTVELSLEMDVIQSYMFDWDLLPCFIERQHVEDDTPGLNTVDEGLELGELVDNSCTDWTDLSELCIMVLASFNPNYTETTTPIEALPMTYDGIFSGLKVFAVDPGDWQAWGSKLDALNKAGFTDGIVSMWMYPKALVKLGGDDTWGGDDICHVVGGISALSETTLSLTATPNKLDGYTPVNKKLLTYPYNFLYVSNNNGGSAVYHYERFKGSPLFWAVGTVSPDAGVKIYPMDYNSLEGSIRQRNYEMGLSMPAYPMCAWDADLYKIWLAQNQNQHTLAKATSGGMILAGGAAAVGAAFTGNLMGVTGGIGLAVSGAQQIAGLIAEKADRMVQPDQARGNFSSNVNAAIGKQTFSFYRKSVNSEHAQIIDDYFTMYGYKIAQVQTPNLAARPGFTYIKTVNCKIGGNFNTGDMVKIEQIFDNGITFWKDGDAIGNYNISNW